jgi:hypothetical protein
MTKLSQRVPLSPPGKGVGGYVPLLGKGVGAVLSLLAQDSTAAIE